MNTWTVGPSLRGSQRDARHPSTAAGPSLCALQSPRLKLAVFALGDETHRFTPPGHGRLREDDVTKGPGSPGTCEQPKCWVLPAPF